MNDEASPSHPRIVPAWQVYLGAGIFVVPTLALWLFSTIFLLPRLETIWHQAGLTHSRAQWLLDVSRAFKDNGRWLLAGVVLLLVGLETRVRAWPRYRWRAVVIILFIFNTAVLVGLTVLCVSVLLAAPRLAGTR